MTVAEAMKKMILLSNGNRHDINHFLKVHAYAAAIGACESLPEDTLKALELAAIVHDIACPLCREKYGNTNGKFQELEGATLTRAFFADTGIRRTARAHRLAGLSPPHASPDRGPGPPDPD